MTQTSNIAIQVEFSLTYKWLWIRYFSKHLNWQQQTVLQMKLIQS